MSAVSAESKLSTAEQLQALIPSFHTLAPDTVGDRFGFSLESWDEAADTYTFRCRTEKWMANAAGSLHGGMAAAAVDQAMGFVVHCIQPGAGFSPTVEMQMSYHRPLRAEGALLVRVQVLTRGKSLMHLRAEVYGENAPDKLCVSATAVYAFVPAKE